MKDILNRIKIDQIAIATKDADALVETLQAVGLNDWIRDEVVATGSVRGEESQTNDAKLRFNYQMGIEFEVLEYTVGKSWHDELRKLEGGANFLSHIGFHIHDEKESVPCAGEIVSKTAEEKLQEIKAAFLAKGFKIAQEVWTDSHTNAYLQEQKRKYHYIIFDTREEFGFDVKLIVRRENAE